MAQRTRLSHPQGYDVQRLQRRGCHARLAEREPVYSWVRLAQRVPARIAIDKVPPGVPLVSGLTATVTIRNGAESDEKTLLQRLRADVEQSVTALYTFLDTTPVDPASK